MITIMPTTRIIMPETQVRLSAGRMNMIREGHAMCFFDGENSIFAGDNFLTTPNPDANEDLKMFEMLGLNPQKLFTKVSQPATVETENSQFKTLDEKAKWSRASHTKEKNLEASAKRK